MKIKVGDRIKTVGNFKGFEGIVVWVFDPGEYLTEENHGSIDIVITKKTTKKHSWLQIGEWDNYTFWKVEKQMKVIKGKLPVFKDLK